MKRTLIQGVLFSVLLIVILYVVQMAMGMYLTAKYAPDVAQAYESVDFVQREVSFGYVITPVGQMWQWIGLIVLGTILLSLVKVAIKRMRKIRK